MFRLLGFFFLWLLDAVIAGCMDLIVIDHGIVLPYRATYSLLIASTSLDLSIAVVEKNYKFSAFLHFEDFSYV